MESPEWWGHITNRIIKDRLTISLPVKWFPAHHMFQTPNHCPSSPRTECNNLNHCPSSPRTECNNPKPRWEPAMIKDKKEGVHPTSKELHWSHIHFTCTVLYVQFPKRFLRKWGLTLERIWATLQTQLKRPPAQDTAYPPTSGELKPSHTSDTSSSQYVTHAGRAVKVPTCCTCRMNTVQIRITL